MNEIIIALIGNLPAILTAFAAVVAAVGACIAAWHGAKNSTKLDENTAETIKGKNAAVAAAKVGVENTKAIESMQTQPSTTNIENVNVDVTQPPLPHG